MRWFRFGVFIVLFLFAVYAIVMLFVDESKNFTLRKQVDYPIEKVYPQFNNLQNFSIWNDYFVSNPDLNLEFFVPYAGNGSSMSFFDKKRKSNSGDLFIRYENPNKTLKYQLFEGKKDNPYLIDLRFLPQGNKTTIIWNIHTPKLSVLKRGFNLISEDFIADNIDKSMKNLHNLLSNKVDQENLLSNIRYDSLMVEEQKEQILLGVNVSSKNSKDLLYRNIVMNHNKVINFVKMDLGKRDDEFGSPVLITDADNFKEKEVSYYLGVPLSKRVAVSDNNFSFRPLNASKVFSIFYKGNYANRVRSIQQLLHKAKKDSLRNGDLQQIFLEPPVEGKEVLMKLSLPVH